ncbi:hypothetical protein ACLKA6_015208 [Drosophila palustris]
MKHFVFFGSLLMVLAIVLATDIPQMPQMPQMPSMPKPNSGFRANQFLSSGFKQVAGQRQPGPPPNQQGPNGPNGPNGQN